jgi:hypothetical protein
MAEGRGGFRGHGRHGGRGGPPGDPPLRRRRGSRAAHADDRRCAPASAPCDAIPTSIPRSAAPRSRTQTARRHVRRGCSAPRRPTPGAAADGVAGRAAGARGQPARERGPPRARRRRGRGACFTVRLSAGGDGPPADDRTTG